MSKRRRSKRAHEISKRCRCADKKTCLHHWFLRVYAQGRRQRIDLTATFPGDPVDVAAAKAKALAQQGPVTLAARPTLAEVVARYVQSQGCAEHYTDGLRALLGDDIPIEDIRTADIKRAADAWGKRPRGGPIGVRHFLQTARHLWNWAVREGYATRTPFKSPQGVTLITVKAGRARTRRLEPGEAERILDVATGYIKDFFTAMLETGCRPGELRHLQWADVRDDEIVLPAAKTKTRKERRIPIVADEENVPPLREILDRRRNGPDGNPLPSDAFVFGSEVGELVSRRQLCRLWLATCADAHVENLHLHDLRGEFGSQLLEAGVPMHEVRDALGHANISMTSTYLRTRTGSLASAYARRHQLRIVPSGTTGQRKQSAANR